MPFGNVESMERVASARFCERLPIPGGRVGWDHATAGLLEKIIDGRCGDGGFAGVGPCRGGVGR